MTDRIRRPLTSDRLPVLPPGVPFLMQALHDDKLGFAEIAHAIEKVPTVAARLLSLANSAWSAPARPVTSLETACGRLGLRLVRTVSIALAISQPFNPARCPAFDGVTFWTSALLNAEAASRLSERAPREGQATARTAALLGSLGLLWLAETLPSATGAALDRAREAPHGALDLHLVEQCGLGYVEAGALLAEAWGLPALLREAIARQLDADGDSAPLCQTVSAGIAMVAALQRGLDWDEDPRLSALGIDTHVQRRVFADLGDVRERTGELAATLFGAR